MRTHNLLIIIALATSILSCHKIEMPHTDRTDQLIAELLSKLDSTEIYTARKLNYIKNIQSEITDTTQSESAFVSHYKIADKYANYSIDSSLLYINKAINAAIESGNDSLKIRAELKQSSVLTTGGFYVAAREILESIQRDTLKGENLISYYNAWSHLYHELYSSHYEPASFQSKYRNLYATYRDSLLDVVSHDSRIYLRNMEKKEARLKNIEEAIKYSDLRLKKIENKKSPEYGTWLYDRYQLAAYYDGKLTGEAIDYLLVLPPRRVVVHG